MAGKFSRYWPRFSLRTLLLVLTVVAVSMGYITREYKTARDRQSVLAWIGGRQGVLRGPIKNRAQLNVSYHQGAQVGQDVVSWLRAYFGDGQVDQIYLPGSVSNEECLKIVQLFPEAIVEHHWSSSSLEIWRRPMLQGPPSSVPLRKRAHEARAPFPVP